MAFPLSNTLLLQHFIASFNKLGDTTVFDRTRDAASIPPEMDAGADDSPWARRVWKPAAIRTDRSALDELYQKLPDRFPPLYEELVLSYRWFEADLHGYITLLANAPGPTLRPLMDEITADLALVEVLFARGLIPFGRASGGSYDPICFDTLRRRNDGDYPIVRVEHEAMLCDSRIGESWVVAGSFRTFLEKIVADSAE
jgi:hypothetical protein